ncbi:hypothetical protein [Planomicrobium sp. YIM 101495]|uniref:hypothetical protein n=1 Tax=Planomicrobium sp. YIM 101495 TaxID=2665160 RepID=UPI0012B74B9D|nr:hypothetical protein [Planomicrobium sp. YIM 101495]MTD31267.1 hypothetical protein [Planomicrobium sp. YIM 101495]
MERLADLQKFQWIKDETVPIDFDHWTGSRILNLIPDRFRHFCKIIHPIRIDPTVEDEQIMWHEIDPVNYELVLGERIRLKDLAEKYDLPLTKELSLSSISHKLGGIPRYLIGGAEGEMEIEEVNALVDVLQPYTANQNCYFYYDLLKTSDYVHTLFHGNLQDARTLTLQEGLYGSPSYWWPDDRSWCIYTDYDLNFSLFGGSHELVKTLLAHSYLECIEAEAETRIDYKADMQ